MFYGINMTKSRVDKLGDSLRLRLDDENLAKLDQYRKSFIPFYLKVVTKLKETLKVDISGRSAKSTVSIREKLNRTPMRLSQMQDIAGCRVIAPDMLTQRMYVEQIKKIFNCNVFDRIQKPSYGYRAIHVIAMDEKFSVEIQVRTKFQHLWAELSERMADFFGTEVKYGGGSELIQKILTDASDLVYSLDTLILDDLDVSSPSINKKIKKVKSDVENHLTAMISNVNNFKGLS